jgi:glycine/D-amino acid oxidase-like deaminating enzyme
MSARFDVVIVGGGVMGSSVAYFLRMLAPALSVCVIERDPSYRFASSALSASSIRQQFSTPINIAMSQFGFAFYRDWQAEIALVERGYLYLASEAGAAQLQCVHQVQRDAGAEVVLLDCTQLLQRFPWLSTRDIVLGSLGLSGEGWFDGYPVLQTFRRKTRASGAEYITGDVQAIELQGDRVRAARLSDGTRIQCATLVNAAGPHARAVAQMTSIDLPVHAESHSVFVFDCPTPPADVPLVIDPSGMWFRPEGKGFIGSPPPDPVRPATDSLDVEYSDFETRLWPALATRVPAFAALRTTGAWAGHYEMNRFDGNALIGRAEACENLYLITGFSGHGMQHAPAAGRGLAELIAFGAYRSLDLSPLSPARIGRGEPLIESNII